MTHLRFPAMAATNGILSGFFNPNLETGFVPQLPRVNVQETDQDFMIELQACGYEKADFKLKIEQNQLTISAEIAETAPKNYVRKEFSKGSFERSFSLPKTVDAQGIKAVYLNGILSIALPKKEEAKPVPPRVVEVG